MCGGSGGDVGRPSHPGEDALERESRARGDADARAAARAGCGAHLYEKVGPLGIWPIEPSQQDRGGVHGEALRTEPAAAPAHLASDVRVATDGSELYRRRGQWLRRGRCADCSACTQQGGARAAREGRGGSAAAHLAAGAVLRDQALDGAGGCYRWLGGDGCVKVKVHRVARDRLLLGRLGRVPRRHLGAVLRRRPATRRQRGTRRGTNRARNDATTQRGVGQRKACPASAVEGVSRWRGMCGKKEVESPSRVRDWAGGTRPGSSAHLDAVAIDGHHVTQRHPAILEVDLFRGGVADDVLALGLAQ